MSGDACVAPTAETKSPRLKYLDLVLVPFLIVAAVAFVGAQPGPECAIGGTVSSGKQLLPGVAIVVSQDGRDVAATSTDVAGNYVVRVPPGNYSVRAELTAFAPVSRDAAIGAAGGTCAARVDFTLVLRSRAAAAEGRRPATGAPGPGVTPDAGRTPQAGGFRTLSVLPSASEVAASIPDAAADAERAEVPLPPGFSADAPTETVTATETRRVQINEPLLFGDLAREGMIAEAMGRMGEGGFGGGGPTIAMMGGGPMMFGPGGFGGMRGANRLQGAASYTFGGSILDASPYRLNGAARDRPDYVQQRYGGSLGGPLKIPRLIDSTRTSFFLNYGGNHSRNPVDSYSTVPDAAARAGDLSGADIIVVDPITGRPFDGNRIPAGRIDPAARALLPFIPLPNLPGDTQNFHYVTAVASTNDDINLRVMHTFGAEPQRPMGPRPFDSAHGRQGAGAGPMDPAHMRPRGQTDPADARRQAQRRARSMLNVALNYRRSSSIQSSTFPTLGGRTEGRSWNLPVNFMYAKGTFTNRLAVSLNRNQTRGLNLYAFSRNVAAEAGIRGVAGDPFDWGVPNLSFTSIADLRDRNPSFRIDQRIEISDVMSRMIRRHALRWGGDVRMMRLDSQTDTNARGSFVFTGLYTSLISAGRPVPGTGLDFADFLLGFAQQASVQYGPGRVRLRGRSWNLFIQDDWRVRGTLTINMGLRYEYISPYTEAGGRLVNLDVAPGFTAASAVVSGSTGPFTGGFPAGLVAADRNNLAPRIGVAWKPQTRTTIRTGFGINYNLGAYASIAQQLSGQPPFAVSATSIGALSSPLLIVDPFSRVDRDTTTNTYGIGRAYRLGRVRIWNLDVQRDLPRQVIVSVGYTGTKGSSLDIQRAPNRGPAGLRIAGVQPFIWQASDGRSILHAFSARVRKRMARGISAGGSYTLSKGLDNASSIGGGATVVAQNDQDLEAEWGRSSFDRRHTVNADYNVELPFGRGKRWLDRGGPAAHLFGDWNLNGNVTAQSGAPFTARVTGNFADVARGVNGTLRANYAGERIALDDPTVDRFFNTAAFSVPPAGQFGNAGRNIISGPRQFNANLGLSKNVNLTRNRGVTVRLQANNVFNTVQFSAIDAVVNSPTFGRIVGVRPMRSIQLITRIRL
jgi:hypothetical protein